MLYFIFSFYVSNPSKFISLEVLCWKISIIQNKYIHFNVTFSIAVVQCAMGLGIGVTIFNDHYEGSS